MSTCKTCGHEKWEHVIGLDEDADDPSCPDAPHDSFCMECDDGPDDHVYEPAP